MNRKDHLNEFWCAIKIPDKRDFLKILQADFFLVLILTRDAKTHRDE